jgi:hypothetical protein
VTHPPRLLHPRTTGILSWRQRAGSDFCTVPAQLPWAFSALVEARIHT